jgi:asparagine synthase (glutamine-hydrolysing)
VLVHLYEDRGEAFVDALIGMFAIALWDRPRRRLLLVRDRLGQKPLFYAERAGELAFASEVKALEVWPGLDTTLDPDALNHFLTYLYVPAPHSIYEGAKKLPPGHMLICDAGGARQLRSYWAVPTRADHDRDVGSFVEETRCLMQDAVRLRLRSDVPIGGFLSGGIDSTVVAGLMAGASPSARTFTAGFDDPRFDERTVARATAAAFGTEHLETVVSPQDLTPDELPGLVAYMDEPFGDSSFIPTWYICRAAREHVTVMLSGDGGDNLFLGHERYGYIRWLGRLAGLPRGLRDGVVRALEAAAGLTDLAPAAAQLLRRRLIKALRLAGQEVPDRLLGLVTYYGEDDKSDLYTKEWRAKVSDATIGHFRDGWSRFAGLDDPVLAFVGWEFENLLVDDTLVKVDRASMACSLEVRSPFMDHRLVELAVTMPSALNLNRSGTKQVLKQAFPELLSRETVSRPKQGFSVPLGLWFQQEAWRTFLIDVLSPSAIRRDGIFDVDQVLFLRDAFLANPEARGMSVSAYQLRHRVWALLMFQLWSDLPRSGLVAG